MTILRIGSVNTGAVYIANNPYCLYYGEKQTVVKRLVRIFKSGLGYNSFTQIGLSDGISLSIECHVMRKSLVCSVASSADRKQAPLISSEVYHSKGLSSLVPFQDLYEIRGRQ